jgi:hypothetical protein
MVMRTGLRLRPRGVGIRVVPRQQISNNIRCFSSPTWKPNDGSMFDDWTQFNELIDHGVVSRDLAFFDKAALFLTLRSPQLEGFEPSSFVEGASTAYATVNELFHSQEFVNASAGHADEKASHEILSQSVSPHIFELFQTTMSDLDEQGQRFVIHELDVTTCALWSMQYHVFDEKLQRDVFLAHKGGHIFLAP